MRNSIQIVLVCYLLLQCFSCDQIYFSTPQPVNSKNSYEFPKEYRGVWFDHNDTIYIDNNFVSWYDNKMNYTLPKKELDTSSVYLLKNDKIYMINNEEEVILSQGFPYRLRNDTIFFEFKIAKEIALSKSNFIRKIQDKHLLHLLGPNHWWQLYLLEKSKKGNLIVRVLNKSDLKYLDAKNVIYDDEKTNGNLFVDISWTEKELGYLIENGAFSDTIMNFKLYKTNR